MRAALGLCGALLGGLAGCSPGFEDPTVVIDLRMLGITADQPELVLDVDPENPAAAATLLDDPEQTITLTTLVADPGQARTLEWEVKVCPPNRNLRCDLADDPVLVAGGGSIVDPSGTGATPVVAFNLPFDVVMESISADSALGFGGVAVQAVIELWPAGERGEGSIFGSKRLVVAPREPAARTANANPTIASLTARLGATQLTLAPARCSDPAADDEVLLVPTDQELLLEPVEPEGVRETYVLPTFDGGSRTIVENLRYSWFTTAGRFSPGSTGGTVDAFGNPPKLESAWRPPVDTPGRHPIWLVQRDERGGVSWTEYCVETR